MNNNKGTILKIDLDIKTKSKSILLLKERLQFLINVNLIKIGFIDKIELIKKDNFSCKIYINKIIEDEIFLILFQSILGDDWKRTAITLRDKRLKIRNWNRLFDVKKYTNGELKEAIYFDMTENILSKLKTLDDLKIERLKNK